LLLASRYSLTWECAERGEMISKGRIDRRYSVTSGWSKEISSRGREPSCRAEKRLASTSDSLRGLDSTISGGGDGGGGGSGGGEDEVDGNNVRTRKDEWQDQQASPAFVRANQNAPFAGPSCYLAQPVFKANQVPFVCVIGG
jgi:hypothetical protein